MRIATASENQANTSKPHGNFSSKYKGVSWDKNKKKWRAHFKFHGKGVHIGYFDSEIDAALAFNKVHKTYFGEFSRSNII